MQINNDGKTTETRTEQERQSLCPHDPAGQERTGGFSGGTEPISGRIIGTGGEGNDIAFLRFIIGGILSQLIIDAQQQLAEAVECVDWYQNRQREAQQRLEHLQHLQSQGDI